MTKQGGNSEIRYDTVVGRFQVSVSLSNIHESFKAIPLFPLPPNTIGRPYRTTLSRSETFFSAVSLYPSKRDHALEKLHVLLERVVSDRDPP